MEQAYKVTQAHQSTQASHTSQQTVERATDERTTVRQSALYRQFNRVIAYFFADTDEELNDFDALRDVRLFDLVLFCTFLGTGLVGSVVFATLIVVGMFS